MKLKGHTKIELTNVKTGKKEVIEHKNTVTSGIEKFLVNNGFMMTSPFNNSTWARQNMWRNLVGGIFLFQNAIDTDLQGNYPTTMPSGNKMIGNGSYNVSNSSTITELGSWNSSESIVGDDTITMVWDWSTSQGNGQIACISLTSDVGGQIGYGNSTSNLTNSTYRRVLIENQSNNDSNLTSKYVGTNNSTYSIKNNIVYWFFNSNTNNFNGATVTLNYRQIPITQLSIFDKLSTRTVTMPSSHTSGTKYIYPMPEGKFLIMSSSNIANNTSGTFLIYDAEADTFTSLPYTNNTGYLLSVGSTNVMCNGKYILFNSVGSSTKHIAVYDISSGTFEVIENALYSTSASYSLFINEDLVLNKDANSWTKIVDIPEGTSYMTNGTISSSSSSGFNIGDNILQISGSGWYRNPLYLATVNNLDSPVTKTAEQTMKITYTLTKE